MQNRLKEIVENLHDCNVEKIEINQIAFSKDCESSYPKDCFEITVIIKMHDKKEGKNCIRFDFSEINEFTIRKSDFWNWLIFDSVLEKSDKSYLFSLDDYININCNKIDYFFI